MNETQTESDNTQAWDEEYEARELEKAKIVIPELEREMREAHNAADDAWIQQVQDKYENAREERQQYREDFERNQES